MKIFIYSMLLGMQFNFLHAQSWSFGIQSGFNHSLVTESILGGNQRKIGLRLGVRIDYDLNKNFFISFSPSYSERGSSSAIEFRDTLGRTIPPKSYDLFQLNYLEIPFSLGYKLKLAKFLKFYPFAGIHSAYLIKASFADGNKAQADFVNQEIIINYDNLLKNGLESGFIVHRWEYGYLFGLGIEFRLSKHFKLHLEAQHQRALSDFADGLFTVRFFDDNTGFKNKLYAIKLALMYF
ncbi:MAG: outer membrane beta-barrel protein [Microscillaceae bacterium]|nr:outer membrane beta-barrel protein [Microscillaceae bacterium]